MKIFNREMNSGKTRALVEMMLQPGNEDVIYVAPTRAQAENIAYREADRLQPGVSRDRFIGVAQLPEHGSSYPVPRYVVDEIEHVLGHLLRGRVLAIAGTDGDLRARQERRIRGEEQLSRRDAAWVEVGKRLYALGLEQAEALSKIMYKKETS